MYLITHNYKWVRDKYLIDAQCAREIYVTAHNDI